MTTQATEMMSKTFDFVHLNPTHPMLANLGAMRVVSVLLHETDEAEIGLRSLDSTDPDDIEYYKLSELQISTSH